MANIIKKLTGNQAKDFGTPDFVTRHGNPMREAVLRTARRFRERLTGFRPHVGWGGVVGLIPELDYYIITTKNPDLISPDAEIQRKAWMKFLNSPEGAPYRTSHKPRGEQCRTISQR